MHRPIYAWIGIGAPSPSRNWTALETQCLSGDSATQTSWLECKFVVTVIRRPSLLGISLLLCWVISAQQQPDFSGTWHRDLARAPRSAFGPPVWTIRQTRAQLLLETGGQTFIFKLDGSENTYVDESLGELPTFVRKIRTKARWVGSSTLLTERTSFAEQTDPNTGRVTI